MVRPAGLFTRLYGANPLHLLAVLGCFALTAYSVSLVVSEPLFMRMLVWFLAAVVAHDMVLLPAYSLADRVLTGSARALRRHRTAGVSLINYVRIPVLGSGLLFLMFLPGIIRHGTETHLAATGQDQQPYFGRWLALTVAFVAVSAAVYVLRLMHAHYRRRRSAEAEFADDARESGQPAT